MKTTLAPELEKALLRAIAEGVAAPDIITADELSKKGKIIYGTITYLLKRTSAPLKPASIMLAAHNLFGAPKAGVEAFLRSFREYETGAEIMEILRAARDKTTLVALINKAGAQLASGDLQISDLNVILSKGDAIHDKLEPLSARVTDKFPKPPIGLALRSLPGITDITNGLSGVWIIGGEPGLGKSTLALQISIDVAREFPVAYFDLDGTGEQYFIERLREVFGNDPKRFRNHTKNFYYRENANTLDATIRSIKSPALIVIDSLQTLPVTEKFGKQGLDVWVRRFKDYAKKGYHFLCVSEKQRAEYGEANIGGFKGSGNIEYAGTLCAHILADKDSDDILQFVIVKARHSKRKGHVVDLVRDEEKVFWFNEQELPNGRD